MIFGPTQYPANVNHRGYVLCRGCSTGQHLEHTEPCMCDLHDEEKK